MKKLFGACAVFVAMLSPAWADTYDPTVMFSSVDLSKYAAAVGTLGIAIIGIVLALKAISVIKSAVGKL